MRGTGGIATLPPGGSANEVHDQADSGSVVYGPANLFTSGFIRVSTQGVPGPQGGVTSLVSIFDVPQTSAAHEILYAGQIAADCTANETNIPKVSGEATFSAPGDPAAPNGAEFATLRTSDGDPNVDGDETYYDIPVFPAPFTVVDAQLQNAGDTFQVILNEQTYNADGSLTITSTTMGPVASALTCKVKVPTSGASYVLCRIHDPDGVRRINVRPMRPRVSESSRSQCSPSPDQDGELPPPRGRRRPAGGGHRPGGQPDEVHRGQ